MGVLWTKIPPHLCLCVPDLISTCTGTVALKFVSTRVIVCHQGLRATQQLHCLAIPQPTPPPIDEWPMSFWGSHSASCVGPAIIIQLSRALRNRELRHEPRWSRKPFSVSTFRLRTLFAPSCLFRRQHSVHPSPHAAQSSTSRDSSRDSVNCPKKLTIWLERQSLHAQLNASERVASLGTPYMILEGTTVL